jgi:hypothetical protein
VNAETEKLVRELIDVIGQDKTEAHRNAFIVLAAGRRWSKAKIARYLGVTRARVGQKLEKLENYGYEKGELTPVLNAMLPATRERAKPGTHDALVSFKPEEWADPDLAVRLVELAEQ